ncbi:MAG: hypothetical protein IS860_06325 [Nitrosopumilus sp.]|nr:hypothetical protein [Nitrosopumilus sp.]
MVWDDLHIEKWFDKLHQEFEPKENQFLIVPAETWHSISENKSKDLRIALAFTIEKVKRENGYSSPQKTKSP